MLYDPSSYANINDVQTTHLHLDLTVDFTKKVLSGSVTLDLVAVVSDVSNVILDTRYVDVRSVHYGTNTSLKVNILYQRVANMIGFIINLWIMTQVLT